MKPVARRVVTVVCVFAALGVRTPQLLQAQQPQQTSTPPQDPAPFIAKAEALVDLLAAQEFAKVFAEFEATMKTALPEERLRSSWTALLAQTGPFKRRLPGRMEQRGNIIATLIQCEFERGRQDIQVAFNPAVQVIGLSIRPPPPPAYTPPPYTIAGKYLERDVVVGAGSEWPLPGTLTIPASAGPLPAVILVHDVSAHDRDETVGPNKPFRDLALGLATQGIAVLRYDKRSRVFAAKMQAVAFTVKDEILDDVAAAAELLRKTAEIDPAKIFVLGHGLGGMLIPRMAARDANIAGFILMNASTRPLEESVLQQIRYVASLDGVVSAAEQTQIDGAQKLVESVRALQPGQPGGAIVGGVPVAYWLDLRGYAPHVAARAITKPLLLLHGGRDYRVTAEDLANWRASLGSAPNVTIKSYPGLNHFFFEGTAASSPAEYGLPGHVSEAVVRDIALWIRVFGKGPGS